MIGGWGGEERIRVETIWPLHELKNLQFHNDHDIHRSSNKYETSGYIHDLDLLIIISHDCMFHILRERKKKVSIQATSTLETWLWCPFAQWHLVAKSKHYSNVNGKQKLYYLFCCQMEQTLKALRRWEIPKAKSGNLDRFAIHPLLFISAYPTTDFIHKREGRKLDTFVSFFKVVVPLCFITSGFGVVHMGSAWGAQSQVTVSIVEGPIPNHNPIGNL